MTTESRQREEREKEKKLTIIQLVSVSIVKLFFHLRLSLVLCDFIYLWPGRSFSAYFTDDEKRKRRCSLLMLPLCKWWLGFGRWSESQVTGNETSRVAAREKQSTVHWLVTLSDETSWPSNFSSSSSSSRNFLCESDDGNNNDDDDDWLT